MISMASIAALVIESPPELLHVLPVLFVIRCGGIIFGPVYIVFLKIFADILELPHIFFFFGGRIGAAAKRASYQGFVKFAPA